MVVDKKDVKFQADSGAWLNAIPVADKELESRRRYKFGMTQHKSHWFPVN